jgi:hypothetical protein
MKTYEYSVLAMRQRGRRWTAGLLIGLLLLAGVGGVSSAQAQDETVDQTGASLDSLALGTTSVSGNRELPRVMVVVPWKSATPARLGGRPIVSLVEAALTPVDPEVFKRQLDYYALLHSEAGESAAELAAASGESH